MDLCFRTTCCLILLSVCTLLSGEAAASKCVEGGIHVCNAGTDKILDHLNCANGHGLTSNLSTPVQAEVSATIDFCVTIYEYHGTTTLTWTRVVNDSIEFVPARHTLTFTPLSYNDIEASVFPLPMGSVELVMRDLNIEDFTRYIITVDNGVGFLAYLFDLVEDISNETITPTIIELFEGQSATLTCLSQGNLSSSLTLTSQRTRDVLVVLRDDTPTTQNITFDLTEVTCLQTDTYICSSTYEGETNATKTDVFVICAPHLSQTLDSEMIIDAFLGMTTSFRVEIYGYPEPTNWYLRRIVNGIIETAPYRHIVTYKALTPPYGSVEVTLRDLTREDISTYIVSVDNSIGVLEYVFALKEAQGSLPLEVLTPKTIINMCDSSHNEITVSCRVTKTSVNSAVNMSFSTDGITFTVPEQAEDVGSHYQTQYTFRPVRGGVYQVTCMAQGFIFPEEIVGKATSDLIFYEPPKEAPKITIMEQTYNNTSIPLVTIDESYTGNIKCDVKGGYPPAEKTTIECGTISMISPEYSSVLSFQTDPLTRDMDGVTCSCTAQHLSGCYDLKTAVTLDVRHIPSVVSTPNKVELDEGQSTSLTCQAQGNPPPFLSLTRERTGQVLATSNSSDTKMPSIAVDLKYMTCCDTDTYICSSTNDVGTNTSISTVSVRCAQQLSKPVLTTPFVYISPGDTLELSIEMYGYPAPTKIDLKRLAQGSIESAPVHHAVTYKSSSPPYGFVDVILRDMTTPEDFSTYIISVDNGIGQLEYVFTVEQLTTKTTTSSEEQFEQFSEMLSIYAVVICIVVGTLIILLSSSLIYFVRKSRMLQKQYGLRKTGQDDGNHLTPINSPSDIGSAGKTISGNKNRRNLTPMDLTSVQARRDTMQIPIYESIRGSNFGSQRGLSRSLNQSMRELAIAPGENNQSYLRSCDVEHNHNEPSQGSQSYLRLSDGDLNDNEQGHSNQSAASYLRVIDVDDSYRDQSRSEPYDSTVVDQETELPNVYQRMRLAQQTARGKGKRPSNNRQNSGPDDKNTGHGSLTNRSDNHWM